MGKISVGPNGEKTFMSSIKLVTLPIGNVDDITIRALNTLKEAKYIFAEDTRVIKKLLNDLTIPFNDKNINSFHDHSEEHKLNNLINLAKENEVILVSDAGSPIISDPAFPVIQKALEENIELDSVSGISAVTYALELSGLAPTPFHFHGFIAREGSKRNESFDTIKAQYGTHIFFEAPSRIMKTLHTISELFCDHKIVVARELSKSYQSVYRFKGSEFSDVKSSIVEKGEFVILIGNENKSNLTSLKTVKLAQDILSKGAKPKLVSKLVAEIIGENSKDIYELIMKS